MPPGQRRWLRGGYRGRRPAGGGSRRERTQLPPNVRPRSKFPDTKGRPTYFPHSNPPGYKIWVGDLGSMATQGSVSQRLAATCHQAGIPYAHDQVVDVQVSRGKAHSGSACVAITVVDLGATKVFQLT